MNAPTPVQPIKLLLAIDGSAHSDVAVRWVASLKCAGLALHCILLNVQRPVMSGEVGLIASAEVAIESREQERDIAMLRATDVLRGSGVPHTPVVVEQPDTAAAIMECAANYGCDAIVVGRRGRGALRVALLGSVSASVVEHAMLPVIVVNLEVLPVNAAPLRILLATDGSSEANRAATFAGALACRTAQSEVHLLHVRPDITVAETILGPRERLIEQWSELKEAEALDSARDIIVRAGAACFVFPVVAGNPATVILHAALDAGCGLIAMGTRGLGPVSGLMMGSVAQHVVQRAVVPVLLSK